jgi:NAD(P)-dependent dehydrogenase (short-subunit alcohol dehydrogenase family)
MTGVLPVSSGEETAGKADKAGLKDRIMQGSITLITGGASGIGSAVARDLIARGGKVGIFDLSEQTADALAQELGKNAAALSGSVLDEASIGAALTHLESALGPVTGLVCCAGVPQVPKPVETFSLEEWSKVLDSHVTGTFLSCKVVGAKLAAKGQGAIVNLASVVGYAPGPTLAYGPAKAAVMNLTKILAVQWAPKGVRVNAVAPGWTDTPFLRPSERKGSRNFDTIARCVPMGRVLRPEEIARPISFLLSAEASAITGVTLPCDGGFIAGTGWAPYGGFELREDEQ